MRSLTMRLRRFETVLSIEAEGVDRYRDEPESVPGSRPRHIQYESRSDQPERQGARLGVGTSQAAAHTGWRRGTIPRGMVAGLPDRSTTAGQGTSPCSPAQCGPSAAPPRAKAPSRSTRTGKRLMNCILWMDMRGAAFSEGTLQRLATCQPSRPGHMSCAGCA